MPKNDRKYEKKLTLYNIALAVGVVLSALAVTTFIARAGTLPF